MKTFTWTSGFNRFVFNILTRQKFKLNEVSSVIWMIFHIILQYVIFSVVKNKFKDVKINSSSWAGWINWFKSHNNKTFLKIAFLKSKKKTFRWTCCNAVFPNMWGGPPLGAGSYHRRTNYYYIIFNKFLCHKKPKIYIYFLIILSSLKKLYWLLNVCENKKVEQRFVVLVSAHLVSSSWRLFGSEE